MQVKLQKPGLWHLCLVLYDDGSFWWLEGKRETRNESEKEEEDGDEEESEHHH